MTCRETQALDLADFLARPTAPEFAAFRGHYPRCPDCAGEVRAWTELHAALSATTHPSPELLLSYDDAGLAEADRRAIAQHLATCAPCRDELRALAVFDRERARSPRVRQLRCRGAGSVCPISGGSCCIRRSRTPSFWRCSSTRRSEAAGGTGLSRGSGRRLPS
jgi:hypothetical protein